MQTIGFLRIFSGPNFLKPIFPVPFFLMSTFLFQIIFFSISVFFKNKVTFDKYLLHFQYIFHLLMLPFVACVVILATYIKVLHQNILPNSSSAILILLAIYFFLFSESCVQDYFCQPQSNPYYAS